MGAGEVHQRKFLNGLMERDEYYEFKTGFPLSWE
jgi:hypothetical protein